MSGGFIVNAYIVINPTWDYKKDTFHLADNGALMYMTDLSNSGNEALKHLSNFVEMPFNISYSTSGALNTNIQNTIKLSLVSSGKEDVFIYDKYKEKNCNVMIIDYFINTDLTTNKNNGNDISFYNEDFIRLTNGNGVYYDSFSCDYYITKIPISLFIDNVQYYSVIYYVTVKYVMPEFIIKTWNLTDDDNYHHKRCKNIPLLNLKDFNGNESIFFSFSNLYRLTSEENFITSYYQTEQILTMLSSIKNSLDNSSSVVTAVNNNAQTVANEMKNTGNKIVTAVDSSANKLIEFDLGEVPDDIIQELAAQEEYMDEQEEQFKENFDKALEEYEQYTIENAQNHGFYTEVISPVYDMISSFPYVSALLALFLVVIVIVFVFRR